MKPKKSLGQNFLTSIPARMAIVQAGNVTPTDTVLEVGPGKGFLTRALLDTASFSQDAEYLHNFEDGDDFRVKTETSLLAALSAHLSLKVSYVWKHVGVPPAGFSRNDTTTTVGLVATY
jgi:putative salt-induced outer membrane protein YdiY